MSATIQPILTVVGKNRPGMFARLSSLLGEEEINILGYTGYAEDEKGVISLLVTDTGHAQEVLQKEGFNVRSRDAVVVELPDEPGVAAQVSSPLSEEQVNILRTFPYTDQEESGLVFETSAPEKTLELVESALSEIL